MKYLFTLLIVIILTIPSHTFNMAKAFTGASKSIVIDKELNERRKKTLLFVFFNNCIPQDQEYIMKKVGAYYNLNVEKDTTGALSDYIYMDGFGFEANSAVDALQEKRLKNYFKVIGFTDNNIYTFTGGFFFNDEIIGYSKLPGKSCIVSTKKLTDSLQELDVAMHEVAHTYGMTHCPNKKCLMTQSIIIDGKEHDLCKRCKREFKKLLQQQ